jgi:hypothetical protein
MNKAYENQSVDPEIKRAIDLSNKMFEMLKKPDEELSNPKNLMEVQGLINEINNDIKETVAKDEYEKSWVEKLEKSENVLANHNTQSMVR